MYKRFGIAFALPLLFSGCAIHPSPEDFAGVDTYHIVRQIRCEARETVKNIVIAQLGRIAENGDPLAQKLVAKYARDPESINTFHYDVFKGKAYAQVRSVFKLFYDTGIAYNFDLTMTENNNLNTDIGLLRGFARTLFSVDIKAGADRQRSNKQTFTVTDTFSGLLTTLNTKVDGRRYCDGQIVHANYIYPIAGRVGIDKVIKTFIRLTLFGNLRTKVAEGTSPFASELTFTTKITASATPKVVFTPINTEAVHIASADLTGLADRTDKHQVTVGLSLDPSGAEELDPFRSYLFSSTRRTRIVQRRTTRGRRAAPPQMMVIGRRITGGGTPAEALAVVAIDQLKSREFQLVTSP